MGRASAVVSAMLFVLTAASALAQTPTYGYEVLNRYPHDTSAFTEGLEYVGGALYESTGLYGSSTLRQVDLRTGTVLRSVSLASQYFGEGATVFGGKIYQLTWQSQTAFVYDAATFAPLGQFFYTGEGWGLTHDARYLIMSDGTSQIRFVDPGNFQTVRTISVRDQQGSPLTNINELEYINGEIYANVWLTDRVARIDPSTGLVVAWIDFTGLLPAGTSADVLNGIAYDSATTHLLVTGKLWPYLFEVRLTGSTTASADGTTVPTTASQIVDANGAVWTIGAGSVILRNGASTYGYGTKILWQSATIYVYGTDGNWWQWTGSNWVKSAPGTTGGTTGGGTTTTPSADGTTVPTTATQIVDNNGAVWTIGAGSAILRNGSGAAGGYGTKILWQSSTIYVFGTDSNWWQWTGSGWMKSAPSTTGGTTGGTTTTPSPDGTTVPTTASQIVDNNGIVWTIGPNSAILRNGSAAAGGYGTKILWQNSTIYVFGTDNNWWQFTASGWIKSAPSTTGGTSTGGTALSPSADGTTVPTTASQIVDNNGAVWTVGSGSVILRNGLSTYGYGTKILWKSSAIDVYGTDANWYRWTGSGWLNLGPTQP